jgi:hypothetical protein
MVNVPLGAAASNVLGQISTWGAASVGMWAESVSAVGSSSDVSADNTQGRIEIRGTGNASAIYALSSATDSSGNVTVSNTDGFIGVLNGGADAAVNARSLAQTGNSGDIAFNNVGGLIISNNVGTTVLLQTRAGQASGAVTADNASAIISQATGGTAITLESVGATQSDLTLTNGGLIQGGAGGHAIVLIGGNNNLITNNGATSPTELAFITTSGSITDVVISGSDQNDAIENLNGGIIRGSINLGAGINSILNSGTDSVLETGNLIYLGVGNTLTNNGTLSPGGIDHLMFTYTGDPELDIDRLPWVEPTQIVGNLVQGAGGRLLMNLHFATGDSRTDYADQVIVTGNVDLAGLVTLHPSTAAAAPGIFRITLVKAGLSLTDSGIAVDPFFHDGRASTTLVFRPSLDFSGTDFDLIFDVDYARSEIGMVPNQQNYANMVNDIKAFGVPTFESITDVLFYITDPVEYRKAIDSLTGEGTSQAQNAGLENRAAFMSSTMAQFGAAKDCPLPGEKATEFTDPDCQPRMIHWATVSNRSSANLGGYTNAELHQHNASSSTWGTTGPTFGARYAVAPGASVGWAFEQTFGSYNVIDRWTSGTTAQTSIAGLFQQDLGNGAYVRGLFSAGLEHVYQTRYVIGRRVTGEYVAQSVGGVIEVGAEFDNGVAPYFTVSADRQYRPSFDENDTTWGNRFHEQITDSRVATLGVRYSNTRTLQNDQTFTVFGGMSGVLEMNPARTFQASPLAALGFTYATTGLPPQQTRLAGNLGVEWYLQPDTSLHFQTGGHVSSGSYLLQLNLNLRQRF